LRAALEARTTLPDDTFLTVNLSPGALASSAIRPILRCAGTLSRLVVEISEHSVSMIAVVQMLGEFAARLDSWLIARRNRADRGTRRAGIASGPAGTGLSPRAPAAPWSGLRDAHRERLPARAAEEESEGVAAALAELRPCVQTHCDGRTIRETFDACPRARHLVQVDGAHRPVGMLRREAAAEPYRPLIVSPLTTLRDAAWRAMQRPAEQRFDPLVCTTAHGEDFGIISIERLLTALAR
jgi:hypothetical protein